MNKDKKLSPFPRFSLGFELLGNQCDLIYFTVFQTDKW